MLVSFTNKGGRKGGTGGDFLTGEEGRVNFKHEHLFTKSYIISSV